MIILEKIKGQYKLSTDPKWEPNLNLYCTMQLVHDIKRVITCEPLFVIESPVGVKQVTLAQHLISRRWKHGLSTKQHGKN